MESLSPAYKGSSLMGPQAFSSHSLSLFRVRHPTTGRFAMGKDASRLSPRRLGSQSAPAPAQLDRGGADYRAWGGLRGLALCG